MVAEAATFSGLTVIDSPSSPPPVSLVASPAAPKSEPSVEDEPLLSRSARSREAAAVSVATGVADAVISTVRPTE